MRRRLLYAVQMANLWNSNTKAEERVLPLKCIKVFKKVNTSSHLQYIWASWRKMSFMDGPNFHLLLGLQWGPRPHCSYIMEGPHHMEGMCLGHHR